MKIKIDEDMPRSLAEAVRKVVPDTLTVIDEGLSGILDPGLWEIAQKESVRGRISMRSLVEGQR